MSRFLSPTLEAVTPYTPGEQPQDQQQIFVVVDERHTALAAEVHIGLVHDDHIVRVCL